MIRVHKLTPPQHAVLESESVGGGNDIFFNLIFLPDFLKTGEVTGITAVKNAMGFADNTV